MVDRDSIARPQRGSCSALHVAGSLAQTMAVRPVGAPRELVVRRLVLRAVVDRRVDRRDHCRAHPRVAHDRLLLIHPSASPLRAIREQTTHRLKHPEDLQTLQRVRSQSHRQGQDAACVDGGAPTPLRARVQRSLLQGVRRAALPSQDGVPLAIDRAQGLSSARRRRRIRCGQQQTPR